MNSDQSIANGFTGTVNLKLTDLIQMVCLYRSKVLIRIHSNNGTGTIHVADGQIRHAETESSRGDLAFFEILGWKDGSFEMAPYPDSEVPAGSIDKPWEHLLLEAIRLQDEGADTDSTIDSIEDGIDAVFDGFEVPAAAEPEGGGEINVLIVDDSSFFARQLKRLLEADPEIHVVGNVRNGKDAIEFLASNSRVDLITLDVQMPVMNGDTALKHIMIRYPVPVLIVSALESGSMPKLFDFLQAGAVDFLPKPAVREDIELYGESLRRAASGAARADVSRFKRWRKARPEASMQPELSLASSTDRVLAIVGAEGAYMDWFRLPLARLCRKGIVLGLQQMASPFLDAFCRLVAGHTSAEVQPLGHDGVIGPGRLYLGNASRRPRVHWIPENTALHFEALSSEVVRWKDGAVAWIEDLAERIENRLSICFLSGAQPLPAETIEKVLAHGARIILAPHASTMCTDLIDCADVYSDRYPNQVIQAPCESLAEIW